MNSCADKFLKHSERFVLLLSVQCLRPATVLTHALVFAVSGYGCVQKRPTQARNPTDSLLSPSFPFRRTSSPSKTPK